ncbi:MAG: response regulator [Chloroflexi bacterium]|nr:response regulator [Chloroflexota bacterium]MYD49575.1 response regulator [Chloroflexota bacterium]
MDAITVLVVDDEADVETLIRQRMRRDIRAGRYDFRFARSGKEALELLEQESGSVHLILTDLNMPEMDGFALLDALSGLDPLIPSVVVSAYEDGERMSRAAALGAEGYVVKPVDFKELRGMLEARLDGD